MLHFSYAKTAWFVHSKKLKILWKGTSGNIFFFKIQVYQSISRYYGKDFKLTSIEAILVILLQNSKLFLSVEVTLETIIQNNYSKSRKWLREISEVYAAVQLLSLLFTVILLMFMKVTILCNFIMVCKALLVTLVSSQPCLNYTY